jgi:primosomal replication protein N
MNEVTVSGLICDLRALRFTPTGVPVAEFLLRHESVQEEAGHPRRVALDLPTIAFGALARQIAAATAVGTVTARGFLAQRNRRSAHVVLHANAIEFN